MPFERAIVTELAAACRRRAPLIQVIVGPRQVGKTTAAQQVAATAAALAGFGGSGMHSPETASPPPAPLPMGVDHGDPVRWPNSR